VTLSGSSPETVQKALAELLNQFPSIVIETMSLGRHKKLEIRDWKEE
jgi:hypothetical protein